MTERTETNHEDPLSPAPVAEPHRDAEETWVLSRYADVTAAFREPKLSMGKGRGKESPELSDANRQQQIRSETLEVISPANLARWQEEAELFAAELAGRLPRGRVVDAVQEFARPWSLRVATFMTGADPTDSERLEGLARKVSLATADPSNPAHQSNAGEANAELKRALANSPIPMGGPAFVALSQTLPCFLANAWLALLRHPVEMDRLRSDPGLLPRAIEELLRYAGIGQRVTRYATGDVTLAGISIKQGDRVILALASANRDPEQFPDPNRLDLTRRATGHVAFGLGPHSCAAATLIRAMATVATWAFVKGFVEGPPKYVIAWEGGRGFRWASSLHVLVAPSAEK